MLESRNYTILKGDKLQEFIKNLNKSYDTPYWRARTEKQRIKREKIMKKRAKIRELKDFLRKIEKPLMLKFIEEYIWYKYTVEKLTQEQIARNLGISVSKIQLILKRIRLKKDVRPMNYGENIIKDCFKTLNNRPNSQELLLNSILQKEFPKQWKFVGTKPNFLIGDKKPDFIHKKKRKIIELFGEYHHLILKQKKDPVFSKKIAENERINYFKKLDYDTLIFWSLELKDTKKIINKVKDFAGDY